MNLMALLLACVLVTVPAAAADEGSGGGDEEPPCSFFSWTLTPPDYRIDPDCPPADLGFP